MAPGRGSRKPDPSEASLATTPIERAAALHQAGRLDEAYVLYAALARGPVGQRRIVLQLLALLERQRGRWTEALAIIDQLFAMGERSVELFITRGDVLRRLGRLDEALQSFDRALAIRPDLPTALNDRADLLDELGRANEALASYAAAIRLRPDYAVALSNQGLVLQKLGRLDEALSSYDQAVLADPELAVAWNNRSAALRALRRPEAALASAERALVAQPDYPEAANSRAAALTALDRFEAAVAACDDALQRRPAYPQLLNTKGFALAALARFENALDCYAQALALDPDYAEAEFNQALSLLRLGRFEAGWRAYEARWRRDGQPGPTFANARLWLGDRDIAGLTLLLHCEQGLGDTLQFCRYAQDVAERGAKVVLQVQPALKPLLSRLKGVDRLVGTDEPVPSFDLHTPLMSLPLALGPDHARSRQLAYLQADPAREQDWRTRLPPTTAPRIGLVWSGNPAHADDRNRSLPLDALAPILACNAQFISLQKDLRSGEEIELDSIPHLYRVEGGLQDFADTAALAAICDVVISVDTAVAHLAGALGKPVWIMLPYQCDWRWTGTGDECLWYSSARLIRQHRKGAWADVINSVVKRLQ